jgi:hypothetical protein
VSMNGQSYCSMSIEMSIIAVCYLLA